MAARYWVGGTSNWNNTASWAATSGGASGASIPVAADDVFFDANSGAGTATLDVAAFCNSLQSAGSSVATFVHNSSRLLSIGSATAGAGAIALDLTGFTTYTRGNSTSSAIALVSTAAGQQTLDFKSFTIGDINFNGTGSWKCLSGFSQSGSFGGPSLTITQGTIDFNSKTYNIGWLNSVSNSVRNITWGNSIVTCSGTDGGGTGVLYYGSNMTSTATGLTFSARGKWYGSQLGTMLSMTVDSNGMQFMNSGFNATNVFINGSVDMGGNNMTAGAMITVNGASASNRILISNSSLGTQKTITAPASSLNNVDFQDINLTGGAAWSGTMVGDRGGNTGLTPTPATTQTWSGTSGGNWSSNAWTTHVPLPQDSVVINAAFVAAQTITANVPVLGGNISFVGATGTPTLAINNQDTYVFGSITLISGMNISGSNQLYLAGRGSYSLTSAGKSFTGAIVQAAFGGEYTLNDNFATTSNFTLSVGTLILNGFNLTCSTFNSSGSGRRTIDLIAGNIIPTGTGTIWETTTATNLTYRFGTGTVAPTNVSATNKTINSPSGGTSPAFTTPANSSGQYIFNSAGNYTMYGMNLGTGTTHTFQSSRTVTFTTSPVLNGSSGNVITIQSGTSGTAASFSSPNNIVNGTYLSLKDNTPVEANKWFAGPNSTLVSNTGNWSTNKAVLLNQSASIGLSGVPPKRVGVFVQAGH